MPTSWSPAASPTPRWSSVRPPGGTAGRPTTTTRSPARCAPGTSSSAARRPPAATSRVHEHRRPHRAGLPDRRDRRRRLLGHHQAPGHRRRRHPDTVNAQLLYEIGDRATSTPTSSPHFDTAELADLGDDRVEIRGVQRLAATTDRRRSRSTRVGGWRTRAPAHRSRSRGEGEAGGASHPPPRSRPSTASTPSRRPRHRPHDPDTRERRHRAVANRGAGHGASSGACLLIAHRRARLSSYPGLHALARPNRDRRSASTGPRCSTSRRSITRSYHDDGTTEVIPLNRLRPSVGTTSPPAAPIAPPTQTDELVDVSLGEIVHARSGDKGGDANLGVWVRDPTPGRGSTRRSPSRSSDVCSPRRGTSPSTCYELPNLGALNFVIQGLLGRRRHLDAAVRRTGQGPRRVAAGPRTTKVPRARLEAISRTRFRTRVHRSAELPRLVWAHPG